MNKILYLQSRLRSGGPSNQLSYIIKHLNKDKFEPVIVTISPEKRETARPLFESWGIPIHCLGMGRIEGVLRSKEPLRNIVDDLNPDLVHSQGWRPDLLSAYHLSGLPRVATVRNHAYQDYVMKFGSVRGRIMAWSHLQALKQVDEPVGCSRSVAEYLRSCNVQNASYIQNGVDRNQFHPVNKDNQTKLRNKLELPQNCKVLVSVGHLRKRKDPITVLKGYSCSEASKDSTLIMIGEGPLRSECEAVARSSNKDIRFTGRVENVHEYLQCADMFISASRSEGLPNTVMEASSTALPLVLSNIKPHVEIIDINREAGSLFSVGKPEEMAIKLDKTLSNLDNQPSGASLAIAKKVLNARRMSGEYQNIYSNII